MPSVTAKTATPVLILTQELAFVGVKLAAASLQVSDLGG